MPRRMRVLDESDEIAALEAIRVALTEVGDGGTYVWRRNHGRLSGIVQPTASFKDPGGRVCRHIVLTMTVGTATGARKASPAASPTAAGSSTAEARARRRRAGMRGRLLRGPRLSLMSGALGTCRGRGAADMPWLWAVFTVAAAGGQVLRNAMQKELTATLGTVGATHVRFLFGLPFALVFLVIVLTATQLPMPALNAATIVWTVAAALAQIAATALLLAAMQARSFVVTTAYAKTEPVQVAIFGLAFLGDKVTPGQGLAILIATAGVLIVSWPRSNAEEAFAWSLRRSGSARARCLPSLPSAIAVASSRWARRTSWSVRPRPWCWALSSRR